MLINYHQLSWWYDRKPLKAVLKKDSALLGCRDPENRLLAIFRDENDMIFALPCGRVLVMHWRH
jgi:hypothetical protein